MSVDLLKIPGIEPKRNRPLQRALKAPRPRRNWVAAPRNPIDWTSIALAVFCIGLALYLINVFWSATRVQVEAQGLDDGMEITSSALVDQPVRIAISPADRLPRIQLALDGVPVDEESYKVEDGAVLWQLDTLLEGHHEVSLKVPRPILPESVFSWGFTVDDTAPVVDVPQPYAPVGICEPVTLTGRVEGASSVTIGGEPISVTDGTFALPLATAPPEPLTLVAADGAGNRTERELIVPVSHPGGQGVHVTASAWGYEPLRQGILDLIDRGLVSAVQLDLKDEGGIVGYDSQVPLAREVGAIRTDYRIEDTVADLKQRGVRVVGRIVAFRDARLADWAWNNGNRDWVVQTADGQKLSVYGGFTNLASPEVRQYNLDIAMEAVDAGVDDIMWDYIRRPEGDLGSMVFPGLEGTPEDGVVGFLAHTHEALRERCAYQGAAVFGISADRPGAVGQDIPRMSRHLDYVAPMLYPSHWVPGELGVADPVRQPGAIVAAALVGFQEATAGTGTPVIPWLQDFTHGPTYGPEEVRAQIEATRAAGIDDWMLWNAGVEYTPEALDPALVTGPTA